MIADTTFLIHFFNEGRTGRRGPARTFFAQNRMEATRTTIISLGEIAPSFEASPDAWEYFKHWKIYRLHPGIADAAALEAGEALSFRQPVVHMVLPSGCHARRRRHRQ